jgi:hypothetical protein
VSGAVRLIEGWVALVFALSFVAGPPGLLAWVAKPLLWNSLLLVLIGRGGARPGALVPIAFVAAVAGVVLTASTLPDVHAVYVGVYIWLESFVLVGIGIVARQWARQPQLGAMP